MSSLTAPRTHVPDKVFQGPRGSHYIVLKLVACGMPRVRAPTLPRTRVSQWWWVAAHVCGGGHGGPEGFTRLSKQTQAKVGLTDDDGFPELLGP